MTLRKRVSQHSIITTFMGFGALLVLLVGGIVLANQLSSRRIEALLLTISEQQVSQITENARLGRGLSQVFADTSLLLSIFLDRQDFLSEEEIRLQGMIQSALSIPLIQNEPKLWEALQEFQLRLKEVFQHASIVNATSSELRNLDKELESSLAALEEYTTEKIITLTGDKTEGEMFVMEQLISMLPKYQDNQSQLKILLTEMKQEHLGQKQGAENSGEHEHTFSMLFDTFQADLMMVTMAGIELQDFGTQLVDILTHYERAIEEFHKGMVAFQKKHSEVTQVREHILKMMETVDAKVRGATGAVKEEAHNEISTSIRIGIGLSVMIVVVLALVSGYALFLLKPLKDLALAAEKMAEGDLDCHLPELTRRDEIGTLVRSFENLIIYIQNMAEAAGQIAEGDLSGNLSPRSQRDRLGRAFVKMSDYLQDMAGVATAIASGDLHQNVSPRSENDVLGHAFEHMKFLRQSLGEILQSAAQLAGASEELNQISAHMASATAEMSQQAEMVSSSSQQISENVEAVAISSQEFASNIREISNTTDNVAHVSGTAVELASSANAIIAELDARSQEITNVVKVITAISQQTNLLALNATIEAARAGESGKGFAVVAHEVKELSRETADSAEESIGKLETIRQGSRHATEAITKVSAIITQIRDLSNVIASGVEQQSITTQDITNRMSDAARGSQDISRIIHDIAETAKHTAEGAADVRKASRNLAQLAEHLNELVQRFTL